MSLTKVKKRQFGSMNLYDNELTPCNLSSKNVNSSKKITVSTA